ncbi:MAG: hypothetical protein ACM37Z_03320 [Deltaproteobacteria bacterium]
MARWPCLPILRNGYTLESFYVAEKKPQPPAAYGKALMTFQEFSQLKEPPKGTILVFVKEKSMAQLMGEKDVTPKKILDFNDWVLMLIRESDVDLQG